MLRTLAVALVLVLFACPDARAQWWPDPYNSEFPSHVVIVGLGDSGPDTLHGRFETTVRNYLREPLAGVTVICDFDEPMGFALATTQRDADVYTNCSHHSVYQVSDGSGRASFTILGGGLPGGGLGPNPTVSFYADGVNMGHRASVAILDLDGVNGVSLSDLRLWSGDYFGNQNPTRSDYSGDGRVTIEDLSIWAEVYFSGTSWQTTSPYCP